MNLGDESVRAAQTRLNTAARRLLLWRAWWQDHGTELLLSMPATDLFALSSRHDAVSQAKWRLHSVLGEVERTVGDVRHFSGGSYSYTLGSECDELEDQAAGLRALEERLAHEEEQLQVLVNAARRLLAEEKEKEKKAG